MSAPRSQGTGRPAEENTYTTTRALVSTSVAAEAEDPAGSPGDEVINDGPVDDGTIVLPPLALTLALALALALIL